MRTTTTLLTRRVAAALVPRPRPVAAAAAATRAASYLATSEAGTAALAAALASAVSAPLAVCLYGDVGAGKSAFARAWVRAAAGDGELPVPSPTYLLHNVYDDVDGPPVHHFDLYRLGGAGGDRVSDAARGIGAGAGAAGSLSPLDADRVGLAAALADGVCLIEWADRLGGSPPAARLDVALEPLADAAAAAAAVAAGVPPPAPSDDPYSDARWRRVTLTAHGDSAAAVVAAGVGAVDGASVVRVG